MIKSFFFLLMLLCFFLLPLFSLEDKEEFTDDNINQDLAKDLEAIDKLLASDLELIGKLIDEFESTLEPEIEIQIQPKDPKYIDAVFIINSLKFNSTGITRQFALINSANLKTGEELTGFEELEEYIRDKTQILNNQRVLADAEIKYTIGGQRADGKYPVDLEIITRDTWNIIAFPKPQYSTKKDDEESDTFGITFNIRDYNFLGTMYPLRVDVGFKNDEYGRTNWLIMLDSDTPFRFFNLNWNFYFSHDFEYRPQLDRPYYYRNITGLSVELPLGPTTFTVGFKEYMFYNEEHSEGDKGVYGDTQKGIYFMSNPFVSWRIPTGFEAGKYGSIYYTPNFSANIRHELPQWPIDYIKKYPTLFWGHNLSFGRIDWHDNLRRGLSAHIFNNYSYEFREKKENLNPVDINTGFEVKSFVIFKENFSAFSGRVKYRHWLYLNDRENGNYDSAGDDLRGIRDKDVRANSMLSLNLDFPFKVMKLRPSNWFESRIFKAFNFDLIMGPFVDAAVYHHPEHQTSIALNNFLVTGGLEAIVFPLFFRSFNLRVSLGINLNRLGESPNRPNHSYDYTTAGKYEIFIGTELFY